MKKITAISSFLGLLASLYASNTYAQQSTTQNPLVLELFTSQSCSSCPPADRLLGELAQDNPNIIALSCNVTYWNHLHWKDTLSKEFCSDRQRSYVRKLNARGAYTPQIVINGSHEMVGSSARKINNALKTEIKSATVKPIGLNLDNSNTLEITLPNLQGLERGSDYTLLLLAHNSDHRQKIPSGENTGRAVTYTNPVEKIVSLGTWDGAPRAFTADISSLPDATGYVVLAQQDGATGKIRAAGKLVK